MTRTRTGLIVTAAALLVTAVTACGTRLTDAQITAGSVATVAAASGGDAQAGAAVPAPMAAGVAGTAVTAPAAGATLAAGGATATAPAAGATSAARTGSVPAGAASVAAAPGAPCTAQGAPIVIGQTGAFSGLVGQSTSNMRTGLAVWAKYINSIGGLQCHPVQLFQEDDNSDPSKASANIDDLVRNKHAIAIVGADVPITVAAARSTADQLGVPVVGGDLVPTDWNQDPNMFPSGGSPLAVYGGAVNQAVHDTGHTKIGLLYCVEASICGVGHQNFPSMIAPSHGQLVFQQSVSLTQSSFTAECQNAKSAGVQILFMFVDGSAAQRVASSCKSVEFQPAYATASIATSPNALNDPNLKAAGIYIGNNEAPFVLDDTPGLKLFHQAFTQFYGGPPPDQSALKGWVSGQLFAAAVNALGATARSGPVTTAEVYQGLYTLKGETLGGLMPPMTYVKGQPAPLVNCYTTIDDTSAGITAPGGSRFACS